jgi:hypothetical protein
MFNKLVYSDTQVGQPGVPESTGGEWGVPAAGGPVFPISPQ